MPEVIEVTNTSRAVYSLWLETAEPISSASIRAHLRRYAGSGRLEVGPQGEVPGCDTVEYYNPQNAKYVPSKAWLHSILRQIRYSVNHGAGY